MSIEFREIPPEVKIATRRLSENGDFAALIKWAAEEHGVGAEEFPEDERLGLFEGGQRRAITFIASICGVDINLVRGELKIQKPENTETNEITQHTEK